MSPLPVHLLFALALVFAPLARAEHVPRHRRAADLSLAPPGRSPTQPIDSAYTKKIHEYTTEPFFLSPLIDYMPASATVPTPKAILGDIAGAPTKLPYSKEVYDYMRLLAKSSPRVRVYTIGHTEEGREMIAVAVASESLLKDMDANHERLAKLADPRLIGMDDAKAQPLIDASTPIYYITGTIHSPETGAPTALMELAYRLAVDESPYVQHIRDHVITLITPVVEVDGRDREVDVDEVARRASGRDVSESHLLGPLRRARQQSRPDGDDAQALAERAEHAHRLEGAAAARSARVGRISVRQHRQRRRVQPVVRSDSDQRVAHARRGTTCRSSGATACRACTRTGTSTTGRRAISNRSRRRTTASTACTRPSATAARRRRWSARCHPRRRRARGGVRIRRCRA